jgi:uncharacterized phage protein (TIGR01671 family)
MRTIKFRGKRVDNGEWETGYYYKLGSQHFIKRDIFSWEVIPETLGQYIGKNDIQGSEIYEGDFIEYQYVKYLKPIVIVTDVIWDYNGFYIRNNQTRLIDARALDLSRIYKVVGNIHDNKELLNDAKI